MDDATTEPRWLDAQEQQAWRQLISGMTVLDRELERRLLERHDLSLDDYAILVLLSEAPGHRLRMSRVAEHSIIARPHVTYRVSRLEKRGIVERLPCEGDARGVEAHLTEGGFALLQAAARDHVRSVREFVVDPLTRQEFVALGATMGRIHAVLSGEPTAQPRRS